MRVIAFDPGKATGMYVVEEDEPHWWRTLDFEQLVLELLELDNVDVFVIEKYIIPRYNAHNSPWSLEVIGAIKAFALLNEIKVVMQKPSDAKNMMPDDTLREHGWYNRKCNDHARDAQRHAALYLLGESENGKLPVPSPRPRP